MGLAPGFGTDKILKSDREAIRSAQPRQVLSKSLANIRVIDRARETVQLQMAGPSPDQKLYAFVIGFQAIEIPGDPGIDSRTRLHTEEVGNHHIPQIAIYEKMFELVLAKELNQFRMCRDVTPIYFTRKAPRQLVHHLGDGGDLGGIDPGSVEVMPVCLSTIAVERLQTRNHTHEQMGSALLKAVTEDPGMPS